MAIRKAAWLAAGLVAIALTPALAGRFHEDHRRDGWNHGDIRRFHEGEYDRWRGGAWIHGEHDGRFGWWWNVGPSWYFYTAPVYPYPDPYTPPVVAAPVAPPSPGGQYWYYCRSPAGYYPYVPHCGGPWEAVPAG
jgi:hypothetical protein